jgi:hypothetical protein
MSARKSLAVALAAVVAGSALVMTAGPASAVYRSDPDDTTFTPVSADLIGVGSDTTQHAIKLLADAWNADASHTFKIATYAATEGGAAQTKGNTITLPGGQEINRPANSGGGRNTLYNPTVPEVDFARSSSAPSVTDANAGLKAFPFALDTLVMAVSGSTPSHAPVNLTINDLVKIYKCDPAARDWSAFGGTAGTIVPQVPPASSGTSGFFKGKLDAANGSTLTYGNCVDQTVQEHDDAKVKGDANAIAPISRGRAELKGGTVRIETGFSAQRAVYNVVRGTSVTDPSIQAVFGENGFICSAAANTLIKQAGFEQLATPAHQGACGTAVDSAGTINFTLNAPVTTTTAVTATSPAANTVTVVAQVSGTTAPTGSVAFYADGVLVPGSVPLVSGQATLNQSAVTAGAHAYKAVYTPNDSVFVPSEGTGSVQVLAPIVKTKPAIAESFPAKVKLKKKKAVVVKGAVSVKGSTGKVYIKKGSKTLKSATLKSGRAKITLPKLKKGTYKLTIVYKGDAKHLANKKTFTIKVVK